MTSISPAQPRPPSSAFPHSTLTRQPSFPSSASSRVSIPNRMPSRDVLMTSIVDERPTKRRKIEEQDPPSIIETPVGVGSEQSEDTQQSSHSRYQRASWATATFRKPISQAYVKSESQNIPPLPPSPWDSGKVEEPTAGRIRTSCRIRANIAVPHVPDALQPPTKVPFLEAHRPIDYFPWTGKHPEDVINEKNVTQGYWDRATHALERELNTARAPLYNAFKHRNGLESLSALFSLVLDQKTKHGALSTSSTFRPPPRVTLTEAKRKSWIADLADENVPLRKLSRTIPQGVRGAALLEQCLIHNVPLNRALWFVKCVGANEIRTLKRKGANPTVVVGAEYKWLRDWTVNIEQFMDSIIGRCGSEKWLENLRYSLQLCARLYHENLLDRDHFLDWVVKSFSNTSLELLAVWLSLVQMWKLDLIRFRKRAKLLALAFLTRYQDLGALGASNMLQEKLKTAIHGLVMFRPACFLLSDRWDEHRRTLRSCLDLTDVREAQIFERLDKRNDRMIGKDFDVGNRGCAARSVFTILDSVTPPFNVQQISQELSGSCSDFHELSTLCLQWATSRFRGGVDRVYLVARLLRRWLRNGSDIGNRILAFFSGGHKSGTVDLGSFRHLFAELSRSQSFSSSRFLQNLTLRGLNDTDTNIDQDGSPTVLQGHLLQDLSLSDTEEHLINLKAHLLRGIGRANDEEVHVERIKDVLRKALQEAEGDSGTSSLAHVQVLDSKELDWSGRFEVSQWLRGEAGHLARLTMIEIPGKPPLPGSKMLTIHQFLVIRDVLEALGDIAILADILSILSRTKQEAILASMVDTVHNNAAALSAIGALEPLQKAFGQTYIALRAMRPSLLLFATALTDLCQSFPCAITPVRALQQDLIRGDRGRALAACSPFSDGIAESLQQAGATFVDDFEAILQGEPNMGEQTMTSLFQVLVGRIMKSDNESHDQSTFALCQLLARLRLFRPSQGDVLIKKWITRMFTAAWSPVHQGIILELISTRCISIDNLLDICEQAPPTSSCRIAVTDMVANSLLSQSPTLEHRQRIYVVRIAARRMLVASPIRTLEVCFTKPGSEGPLLDVCAVVLPKLLDKSNRSPMLSAGITKRLPNIVDSFLNITSGNQGVLSRVLGLADWLSLPFCQYRLSAQTLGEGGDLYGTDLQRAGAVVLETLESKEDDADAELIQALMSAMPNEVSAQVRALMEQRIFTSMSKSFQGRGVGQPLSYTAEDRARSIQLIGKLISLGPAKFVHTTIDTNGILIEKLTIIHKVLGAKGDVSLGAAASLAVTSPVSPGFNHGHFPFTLDHKHQETILLVMDHMELLSRVASMKAGSFGTQVNVSTSAPTKQVQMEQMKILALLASIATQPALAQLLESDISAEQKKSLRERVIFILDVAARIADDLTEEGRAHCAKILKEKTRDERIAWLVGSMGTYGSQQNVSGQGLTVMHETKGYMGEFRPKQWEMLENGGGKEGDTCLGLGLFGAKRL